MRYSANISFFVMEIGLENVSAGRLRENRKQVCDDHCNRLVYNIIITCLISCETCLLKTDFYC